MIRLRAQGHSVARVAGVFGVTPLTVYNAQRTLGWRQPRVPRVPREPARPPKSPNVERGEKIIALRAGGATLQSIADIIGVSRERVRQIEAQFGGRIAPDMRADTLDVLTMLAVIRASNTINFAPVVRACRRTQRDIKHALVELGLLPAVTRLFHWRRDRRYVGPTRRWQEACVTQYRALRDELGRAPTVDEMNMSRDRFPLLNWGWRSRIWETNALTKLRAAADGVQLPRGSRAHRGDAHKRARQSNVFLRAVMLASFGRSFTREEIGSWRMAHTILPQMVRCGLLQAERARTIGRPITYSKPAPL